MSRSFVASPVAFGWQYDFLLNLFATCEADNSTVLQDAVAGSDVVVSRHLRRCVLAAFLSLAALAGGQVSPGTPPFGSFGGGPFDIVNLGNLNVHFSIPVLHKAGRGVPFTFDLSYDSSIWYPVTAKGKTL